MRKDSFALAGVTLVCALILVGCGSPAFKGEAQAGRPAPDFTLTDQYGRPFQLSQQRGKVVLLFFGYTYCPDVCPTTLSDFRQVHNLLGEDAKKVLFVFITVDPERDTPGRLKQYMAIFNASFIGLSGTLDQMAPVYQAYRITREKVYVKSSTTDYFMNHTATVFIIDAQGNWRVNEKYGTAPEDIAHDVRLLLQG